MGEKRDKKKKESETTTGGGERKGALVWLKEKRIKETERPRLPGQRIH